PSPRLERRSRPRRFPLAAADRRGGGAGGRAGAGRRSAMSLLSPIRRLRRRPPQRGAGRGFTLLDDDMLLVSFPRSGNTWLRVLLANLLRPEPVTLTTIEQVVPDVYANADADLLRVPRPRILKSHEPFDARYGRVVYLVRHPVDVAVSFYHFQR